MIGGGLATLAFIEVCAVLGWYAHNQNHPKDKVSLRYLLVGVPVMMIALCGIIGLGYLVTRLWLPDPTRASQEHAG